MTLLSEYNHTFREGFTVQEVVQTLHVGDFLCILSDMRYERQRDETITKQTDVWYLYPITSKTRTSLLTNNLRWNNKSYHIIQTSDKKHGATCWMTQEDYRIFLASPDITIHTQEERNRIVLTHINFWKQP
jgi:hypothetical protein